jgi:fumarate hydratase subunit alpha
MSNIRIIKAKEIEDAVTSLFIKANYILPNKTAQTICEAAKNEGSEIGRDVLGRLCDNISAAQELDIPICQDTGMAVLFADVGENVHIEGASLKEAVDRGVARAYIEGSLRCSVVDDPLFSRVNTKNNTPAILHICSVKGDKIRLVAAPKGFGSENMSAVKMMTPAATEDDIVKFVTDTVREAGSKPCPPIVVGVGIGGTFEYAAYLAKRALIREFDEKNPDPRYAALEEKILKAVNETGIGPQGFGGDTTALRVFIEQHPTHIAGLPVAVNINCHVCRHAETII